jgi:hypothetical protein
VSAERWWWLALALLAVTIGLEAHYGPSNLTTAVALVTAGVTVIALLVDDRPVRRNRRRPW